MRIRKDWSPEEDKQLFTLRTEGVSLIRIGEILGRSKESVYGRWHIIKHKYGYSKVTHDWSHEETELLLALAETLPKTQLVAAYNEAAKKKGYMKRSTGAISKKIFTLGQSIKPQTGWYGVEAIAIGLGFSRTRIHNWLKAGLKYHAEGKKNFYVRNDVLIKWILEHPDSLDNISKDGLRWFLALLKEEKEMRGNAGRPEYTRALFS